MSFVSDLYDAIVEDIKVALPDYDQIANLPDADDNANNLFVKSFGVGFGPGQNTNRLTKPKFSRQLQCDIILVNKVGSTESNVSFLSDQQKSIQEDLFAIIKEIRSGTNVNALCPTKNEYTADSGIDFIDGARAKYYVVSSLFTFEYFETLS